MQNRQAAREEKKKREAEEYQARLARAIERAAAPTFKRTGKPSMARSLTQKKVSKEEGASAAKQEDLELQRYIDRTFP